MWVPMNLSSIHWRRILAVGTFATAAALAVLFGLSSLADPVASGRSRKAEASVRPGLDGVNPNLEAYNSAPDSATAAAEPHAPVGNITANQ